MGAFWSAAARERARWRAFDQHNRSVEREPFAFSTLRVERVRQRFTQKQLAAVARIHYDAYGNVEREQTKPHRATAERIAAALGRTAEELWLVPPRSV